jgi:hypothetical protein
MWRPGLKSGGRVWRLFLKSGGRVWKPEAGVFNQGVLKTAASVELFRNFQLARNLDFLELCVSWSRNLDFLELCVSWSRNLDFSGTLPINSSLLW